MDGQLVLDLPQNDPGDGFLAASRGSGLTVKFTNSSIAFPIVEFLNLLAALEEISPG